MGAESPSPQGPQHFFGELKRSEYKPGAISIFGPTLSVDGEMTYGEVYLFQPPETDSQTVPVVDYEWLQLHIGRRVNMWKTYPEGVRPLEAFLFCVRNERDQVIEQAQFPNDTQA